MTGIKEAYVPVTSIRGALFFFSVTSIVDLLLRPERYFRSYLGLQSGGTPIFLVWILGMGAFVSRADSGAMNSTGMFRSGGEVVPEVAAVGWPMFWLYAAIGGVVLGLVEWWFFGWWFRMRLEFCGSVAADPLSARTVFAHARAVWYVPFLVTVALLIPFSESYKAMMGSEAVALVWVTAPVWSVFVGYRGAVGCFDVDPKKARIWFLILPLVVIGLALGYWTVAA